MKWTYFYTNFKEKSWVSFKTKLPNLFFDCPAQHITLSHTTELSLSHKRIHIHWLGAQRLASNFETRIFFFRIENTSKAVQGGFFFLRAHSFEVNAGNFATDTTKNLNSWACWDLYADVCIKITNWTTASASFYVKISGKLFLASKTALLQASQAIVCATK